MMYLAHTGATEAILFVGSLVILQMCRILLATKADKEASEVLTTILQLESFCHLI